MLLSAFGVDPITVGNVQRILEAQQITSEQTTTMKTPQPPVAPPSSNTTPPTPGAGAQPPAQSQARIEIVNPFPGRGTDRSGVSTQAAFDDRGNPRNEVEVGAIVYGTDGQPTDSATVVIEATDGSQNKTLAATGNVTAVYVNGEKRVVPYYPFRYVVTSAGRHVIRFSALNLSQEVGFEATN